MIPLNVEGLRSLVDAGIRLTLAEPRICLWLDGLDRFTEALDPHALESLNDLAPEVKIVATIRTEEWERLLTNTGQQSEAARTLAVGAEVLELGPLDTGTDQPAREAAGNQPSSRPVRGLSPPWLDKWLGGLVAGLLVTLAVAVALRGDLVEPPPIDEQIGEIKAAAMRSGRGHYPRVVGDKRVRFHEGEADSWVLVVEDRTMERKKRQVKSDELRIYDLHEGRLRRELDFKPKDTGAKASKWQELVGSSFGADYDQDGFNEVIAGYTTDQVKGALLPFAIDWRGAYKMIALTPKKLKLSTRGLEPKAIKFRRDVYETRMTFTNSVGDARFRRLTLTGYRMQALARIEQPTPRVLSGYFAQLPTGDDKPKVLELHANQLRNELTLTPCTPDNPYCRAPKREQDVIVPPDKSLAGGLLKAWEAVGSKWVSRVRVIERKPSASAPQREGRGRRPSGARRGRARGPVGARDGGR